MDDPSVFFCENCQDLDIHAAFEPSNNRYAVRKRNKFVEWIWIRNLSCKFCQFLTEGERYTYHIHSRTRQGRLHLSEWSAREPTVIWNPKDGRRPPLPLQLRRARRTCFEVEQGEIIVSLVPKWFEGKGRDPDGEEAHPEVPGSLLIVLDAQGQKGSKSL